jgi:hypothetical protein
MVRLRKKLLTFSLVTASLGVGIFGGRVLAQSPSPSPPPTPPTTEPATPDGPSEPGRTDEEPPARPRIELSVEDMTQKVEEHFDAMRQVMKRMEELQSLAKKEKDVIKLNCVNDKLAQMRELENIADVARTNMLEAIAKKDEEARYHEFGRVTVARQQADVLGGEAEACIGEDLTFVGPTQVDTYEPEYPEDPTVATPPDFPTVEPLPVASPQA